VRWPKNLGSGFRRTSSPKLPRSTWFNGERIALPIAT